MSIRGLRCLWCGLRESLQIAESENKNDGVQVWCGFCGASGPFFPTRRRAIQRYREVSIRVLPARKEKT